MAAQALSGLLAYIDPTGGLPPSMWGMFLAAILGAVGAALTVLRSSVWAACRWLWRQKQWVLTTALLVGSVFAIAMWFPQRTGATSGGRKVLVLGLDGVDPRLLAQYREEGRLPNFDALAKEGVYHPLATTTPPQSPVAWASFWTATGPESHGVYDFLKRDPKTYMPDLTISDRKTMRLPWLGKPFWESGDGAPVQVVFQRAPVTFPAPRTTGRILAGMGVWDARGTEGTYFYYYAKRPVVDKDARGMQFQLKSEGGVFKGELPGPSYFGQADTVREPFELAVGSGEATLKLQGKSYKLLPGRWSDWVRAEFSQGLLQLSKMKLLTRALWVERDGQTTLYIAPLNFDPAGSPYAISSPKNYAAELAEQIGSYYTRGMPFDTQALTDEVLSDEAFLDQCRMISDESEKMLLYEMGRFQEGLLFAYFEEPDILQHMFWRTIDPEHPLGRQADTARHRDVIPECYQRYDALVGRVRAYCAGTGAALVVLSDHGFGPFRTSIHLNTILRDLGYLTLNPGKTTSDEVFKEVDWSKTRAYAVGFNAVYLNLAGREGKGIVTAEEAPRLRDEIAAAIEKFVDPTSKERVVHKVHSVPTSAPAGSPDLIVGYLRGYRGSWETALGKVPQGTTEKNARKWSGDHCVDASEVPGIFLSSNPAIDSESLPGVGPEIVKYLRGQ